MIPHEKMLIVMMMMMMMMMKRPGWGEHVLKPPIRYNLMGATS